MVINLPEIYWTTWAYSSPCTHSKRIGVGISQEIDIKLPSRKIVLGRPDYIARAIKPRELEFNCTELNQQYSLQPHTAN